MTRWHVFSALAGLLAGFLLALAIGIILGPEPPKAPPYEKWPHG